MSADDVVGVLNNLIQVAQDGREGFAEAAEYAQDAGLKATFLVSSGDCAEAVRELQLAVQTLGSEPVERGSVAGAAHRGWIKLRTRLEDNNLAVLEEVERGEDHAEAVYARALKTRLPPEVKAIVERHRQGVLRNHDRIRDLRNQYRAAA
jgi:uncharacterized protein (TIGR02284 family)